MKNRMISKEQLKALRTKTPGVEHNIHFNNAGASLMPESVIKAIHQHIELEAQIGGYEAASQKRREIGQFNQALARLLNTAPEQIAFAGSATQAYNTALSSVPLKAGDIVLITNEDYVSNQIAFLQLQKLIGIKLIRVADRPQGGFDPQDMERLLNAHPVRLVAVTHVPTSSGLVQDVVAAGALCRKYGCWYLLDACQSAGQLELDVEKLQCDFLTATFRKFLRGPRGTGFLYVSRRVLEEGLEPRFLDLHSAHWASINQYTPKPDARRFETWERSYALMLGAAAATEYALEVGLSNIQQRTTHLADMLRKKLTAIKGIQPLSRGEHPCGIVTLAIEAGSSTYWYRNLAKHHINSSITHRASALIDYQNREVEWALRLSPHYYNTEEEVNRVVEVIGNVVMQ